LSEEKKNTDLSRREFLKDASICAGCAAIGGVALLSACAGKTTTETVTSVKTVSPPASTNTVTVTGPATTVTGAATTTTVTATAAPASYSMTILNPESDINVKYLFAKRLDTLAGKTVAFHACAPTKWQPHRIFPYIADKLLAMTEFTAGAGIDSSAVAKQALDKGANAVVNGFAA
jgi:hypothetical protein